MKALMYHYVRPGDGGIPHLRYLHLDSFRRQLDWLAANVGFVPRSEFDARVASGEAGSGAVLTFDDALSDHYDFVLPELLARGLWGIFYVPTGMYRTGQLLDVHRLHLVLGQAGGAAAMQAALSVITDEMLSDGHIEEFRSGTYAGFDDDAATVIFKRTLNYYIGYAWRERVIDLVAEKLGIVMPSVDSFYLSRSRIAAMDRAGMVMGSHTVGHFVMSKLSIEEQRREIAESFDDLAGVIGHPVTTFCYPYGGFLSFTPHTERLLTEAGSRYAFNVESRDIETTDLRSRPQALPRYDCNMFPHGAAARHPG